MSNQGEAKAAKHILPRNPRKAGDVGGVLCVGDVQVLGYRHRFKEHSLNHIRSASNMQSDFILRAVLCATGTGAEPFLNVGAGMINYHHGWLLKLWSLLGTLNTRCRIMIGIQRGTIILTTTHMILVSISGTLYDN